MLSGPSSTPSKHLCPKETYPTVTHHLREISEHIFPKDIYPIVTPLHGQRVRAHLDSSQSDRAAGCAMLYTTGTKTWVHATPFTPPTPHASFSLTRCFTPHLL